VRHVRFRRARRRARRSRARLRRERPPALSARCCTRRATSGNRQGGIAQVGSIAATRPGMPSERACGK
jgi:hypothetical protein